MELSRPIRPIDNPRTNERTPTTAAPRINCSVSIDPKSSITPPIIFKATENRSIVLPRPAGIFTDPNIFIDPTRPNITAARATPPLTNCSLSRAPSLDSESARIPIDRANVNHFEAFASWPMSLNVVPIDLNIPVNDLVMSPIAVLGALIEFTNLTNSLIV